MRPRRLGHALVIIAAAAVMPAGTRAVAETVTLVTTGKGAPVEWPLFIADKKGFFAANGVTVDLVAAPSTAAAIQQVVGGSVPIAIGGMTDPLRAIDHGARLSLLRVETQIPPYSIWAKPAIKTFKELRGKIVMVGGAKDITLIYFERMAEANGLKPGDYDLLYAGTTPARYASLVSGAVDAAILYPPASFKAKKAGFTNVGDLSQYVKDLPFTGAAANTAWAEQHEDAIVGFLKGFRRGIQWFYDRQNRDEAIALMVQESGGDPEDVAQTYDYFQAIHIFPVDGAVTPQTIASLVAALAQSGDLEGSADPRRFIDPAIAPLLARAQ